MSLPALTSAIAETETTIEAAAIAGGRKAGRPTRFSPQLAEGICALIQFEGFSDTQAALLAGVPRATLSRWKAQDEDFVFELEQARAMFQREHLQRVLQARRPDGTMDWRASAWLLQRMFPEQYGSPAQRQRLEAAAEARTREAVAPVPITVAADASTGSTPASIDHAAAISAEKGGCSSRSSEGEDAEEISTESEGSHPKEDGLGALDFRSTSSEMDRRWLPPVSRHPSPTGPGSPEKAQLSNRRIGTRGWPLQTAIAA